MPVLGGHLYQVNEPLTPAGRSVWQTHLLLVLVPLFIVFAYCGIYLQMRVNQQAAYSHTLHQHQAAKHAVGTMPPTPLTDQAELPVIVNDSVVPTGQSGDQQTTSPQSSASRYLQSGHDSYQNLSVSRGDYDHSFATPAPKPTSHKSHDN